MFGVPMLVLALVFDGRVEPPARYAQLPRAGAACKLYPRNAARTIGDPIPIPLDEGDVRGANGNEIRQIYKVTLIGPGRSRHIGWLFEAMNRRLAYEDATAALGWGVLSIEPQSYVSLADVKKWTLQIARASDKRVSVEMKLLSSPESRLSVRQCFKAAWDGRAK